MRESVVVYRTAVAMKGGRCRPERLECAVCTHVGISDGYRRSITAIDPGDFDQPWRPRADGTSIIPSETNRSPLPADSALDRDKSLPHQRNARGGDRYQLPAVLRVDCRVVDCVVCVDGSRDRSRIYRVRSVPNRPTLPYLFPRIDCKYFISVNLLAINL